MGKLSRAKGAAFEREMANAMTKATGLDFKRVLVETREGNSGDVEGPLNISVQCKVGEMPPIYAAVEQACEAAKPGDIRVALVRRNAAPGRRKADLAVLPLEDFFVLLRYLAHRNNLGLGPLRVR